MESGPNWPVKDFTEWFLNANGLAGRQHQLEQHNPHSGWRHRRYAARLEGGYRYALLPWIGVTPYAAAQFEYFYPPSYNETDLAGGIQAASHNAVDSTDTRSELGG